MPNCGASSSTTAEDRGRHAKKELTGRVLGGAERDAATQPTSTHPSLDTWAFSRKVR